MTNFKSVFITIAAALNVLATGSLQAADKVIVIPMFGSDARCEWRTTNLEPLDTFYKSITSSCNEDEKIITGGFRYGSYNTTRNCRVIASYPILKSDGAAVDSWRVTWGMPTATECDTLTARTHALCCK